MLRLEEICLNLGAFQLQNISLHVRHGEYMVLLGPTGTGKTVLLEVIAGLRFPDEGKIFLNSQDAGSRSPRILRLVVRFFLHPETFAVR